MQLCLSVAIHETLRRVTFGVDTAVKGTVKIERQHHVLLVALNAHLENKTVSANSSHASALTLLAISLFAKNGVLLERCDA